MGTIATLPTARFDPASMALHWLTLVLIVGVFASAWLMGAVAGDQARSILAIHRSLGVTTLAVTLCRLVWRAGFSRSPPLPAGTPFLQRAAARAVEFSLYGLLLAQPVTGLADTLFRGRPFQLFLWQAPALIVRHKALAHAFHKIHVLSAFALIGLIAAHTLAALAHRYILKDHVLQSMLPWGARNECGR
jgi:cytochrome b561